MPTLANIMLTYAERDGRALTPSQLAEIPEYQREIYAAEIERHQKRFAQPLATQADPLASLRLADRLLRTFGWSLLDVAANETTGYVRVVAEARDHARGEGVKITLMRSCHDGEVLELRDRVVLEPGMFESHWTITDYLGRRRFADIGAAARELLGYACDNGPSGALAESEATARRELLVGSGLFQLSELPAAGGGA